MKIVTFILFFSIVISACKKEEVVIQETEIDNAQLYYYYGSITNKKYPAFIHCTINDTTIVITAKLNSNTNASQFSIVTEKVQVGETQFDKYNIKSWAVSINSDGTTNYTQQKYADNHYVEITEIDTINKTISGNFNIEGVVSYNDINGVINKLPYTNTFDENFIFSQAKVDLTDNANNFDDSGKYFVYNADIKNGYIQVYLSDNLIFDFNKPLINGLHNFINYDEDCKLNMNPYFDNHHYRFPMGTYIIKDTIMHNHTYKKISIDAYFTQFTEGLTKVDYVKDTLEIKEMEILIY